MGKDRPEVANDPGDGRENGKDSSDTQERDSGFKRLFSEDKQTDMRKKSL